MAGTGAHGRAAKVEAVQRTGIDLDGRRTGLATFASDVPRMEPPLAAANTSWTPGPGTSLSALRLLRLAPQAIGLCNLGYTAARGDFGACSMAALSARPAFLEGEGVVQLHV